MKNHKKEQNKLLGVKKTLGKINGVFKHKMKSAMAIILTFAMVMTMIPALVIPVEAETSASNTNPAFRVKTYDTSARIEVPYDSTATNYKVYMSTSSGLTNFTGAACVLNSNTYKPYVYALDKDKDALVTGNTISISPDTTYYFYLVINDKTTAATAVSAKTDSSPQYWTSPGNYDISWYNGSASSFNIKTAKQLAGLSVLVNGLNGVSEVDFSGKTVHLTASLDMSAYLWTPIGTGSISFNGTFDGGNYDDFSNYTGSNIIKGLHTNSIFANYQGLFGNNTETIKNIGMTDGYIECAGLSGSIVGINSGTVENCFNTGVVTGTYSCIGGISGKNNDSGIIENCYNTGTVTCRYYADGGISGSNRGKVINCYNSGTMSGGSSIGGISGEALGGVISNSYNLGSVIGTADDDGGIVGIASEITLTNCFNMGTVNGASKIGGIAGSSYSTTTISNSYNLGAVDGTGDSTGGIIGYFMSGTIQNSYNKGEITGNKNAGGIAGCNNIGNDIRTISNCAYLTGTTAYGLGSTSDTTGVANDASGILTIVKTGTTNVWIEAPTIYAASGVFSAGNPVNQGYPVLTSFGYTDGSSGNGFSPDITIDSSTGAVTVGTSYGDGTSNNPYIIRNIYQMDIIRNYIGRSVKLAGNIDISPAEYNKPQDTTGSWSPLPFIDTIDGNGFSVSGIYINNSLNYQGLFGINFGIIKNLGITNGYVKGNSLVGSLCGFSDKVQNSYSTGVVIADVFGGGVTGECKTMLENSYNTGSVTCTDQQAGGIAGVSVGSAMDNYNIGSIEAGLDAGGVFGVNSNGTIINNYNTGAVSGGNNVGGVAGASIGTLSNCFNSGAVNSTNTCGGGVAGVSYGSVSNSYNTGAVNGNVDIGGITGYLQGGTISNSYNASAVSGNSNLGGVVGYIKAGTIANTYYYGCGNGVGSGSQAGTTPFVKLNSSSIKIGEKTAITEQTAFDGTLKPALGADFNINYTRPYTASTAGTADINGTSITGKTPGYASINGTFTLNQNSLTSTGFTGEAEQITVPVSMPLSVAKAVPTVTVSPISGSIIGGTITLTATVNGGFSTTGNVSFSNAGVIIGTCTISGDTASITYTPTAAGSLSITAAYSGDVNNEGAESATMIGTVNKMQPAITLTANPASPGTYPNDVIFKAVLSNVYTPVSGQTITFNVDGSEYIEFTDSSGIAEFMMRTPSAKDHTVTASFAGNTNNYNVTSTSLIYNVNKGMQANLVIGGIPSIINYGDAAFTLVSGGGSGSGTVTYTVEAGKSNVLTVDYSGKVTIVGAGTAKITATKDGGENYNSISKDVTITVAPKALNALITPKSKIYDQTTDAAIDGNISYTGIVGSDDVYIVGGTLKFSDKKAENGKTVIASGYSLSGTKSTDYSMGTIAVNTANITKKPVTLSGIEVKDKTYDGTNTAEFLETPGVLGIISGDNVTFSPGTPKFVSKDYLATAMPVIFSNFSLSGADALNYSLTQPDPVSAKINKKILNVSVNPVIINCGQEIPALDAVVDAGDFVSGENESNLVGFAKPSASQSYGSTTTPVSNAPMAVTYSGGDASYNYEFNYNYNTQLTIQPVNVGTGDYQVTGIYSKSDNPSGWNNSALTVTPKNAYDLISTDGLNWASSLQVQTEGKDESVNFKLKKSSDGTQTEKTAIYYNLDKTAPKGTIKIGTSTWDKFINTITFGLFYNKTVDVSITGSDSLSGVKTIQYQKVASESDYNPNGTWTPYSAFSVSPNEKFIVYAKITDNAGNVTIINSNGVVVEYTAPSNPIVTPAKPVAAPAKPNPVGETKVLTKTSLEDLKTGTKVDGVDKTTFDAKTELVVISIKDTLDKKTKMLFAAGVNSAAKGKEITQLYDVHLLLNGKIVQPDGEIKITLRLEKETKGYKNLQVVYIADDGTATIIPSEQNGDEISFLTDHMSDYGIIGTPAKIANKPKPVHHNLLFLFVIPAIVLLLIIFIVWKRRKRK